MLRPILYNHIVVGRKVWVVNFFTAGHLSLLKRCAIGGVPCSNPLCAGGAGGWDTEPVGWSTDTAPPLTLIDESGVSNPGSVMRAR